MTYRRQRTWTAGTIVELAGSFRSMSQLNVRSSQVIITDFYGLTMIISR